MTTDPVADPTPDPTPDPVADPASSRYAGLGTLLHETARVWRQTLDRRLRPLGLSQAKWRTLVMVSRVGDRVLGQKQLAELLGVEGPTVVGLLDRLEADGWVVRHTCDDDRRCRRIALTAKAREMLAQIDAVAAGLRADVLGTLEPADLDALERGLSTIRARLDDLP